METEDFLQENLSLTKSAKKLLQETSFLAKACAIFGLVIALLLIGFLFYLGAVAISLSADFFIRLAEFLLFFSGNIFLLLFSISLRATVHTKRYLFLRSLMFLKIAMLLYLGLLLVAISYHVIWDIVKIYLSDAANR